MDTTSATLSLLLGLSAAAAVAIVVVIERGAPATPAAHTPALAASQASPAVVDAAPAKQAALMESLAKTYLQDKDYTNAIAWGRRYLSAGGDESEMRPLLAQAHYQLGDYANAARELQWEVQFADRAGRPPGEDRLLLLRQCYAQLDDATAYTWGLEKLVTWYPKPKDWAELLDRMQKRSDFGALQALDVNRLRLVTGTLGGAAEYLAMATQVRDTGFPAEARRVVEHGIANGVLGHGPEGTRHRRLLRQLAHEALMQQRRIRQRDMLLSAQKAKDGIALFDLGYAHVTLGDHELGLALMAHGLSKGGLDGRPEYARLHLGIAQLMAGRNDSALETFKLVRGKHAAPELARLWIIYARNVGRPS